MLKEDIVNALRQDCGLAKFQAENAVDCVFATIQRHLRAGVDVRIHSFGTFNCKTRAARTGRNPKTGESLQIPAKKVVTFKPSSSLV